MDFKPVGARLSKQLSTIQGGLASLVVSLSVVSRDNVAGPFVLIAPDFEWGPPTPDQRGTQLSLLRSYNSFMELLTVTLSAAPKDLKRDLQAADRGFRTWLELDTNWSLRPNPTHNLAKLSEDALVLHDIIAILTAAAKDILLLIPDTNSLLEHPDPTEYRRLVGRDQFEFALLPTVLGELDDLKLSHRDPQIRDLARSTIRRVKGWRQQGSLTDGVVVDKTIIVKAIPEEPTVATSLSWLDPSVPDDRIIASVLDFQAKRPEASLVLITGDINLSNKADAAAIQTLEFPEA